MSAGLSFGGKVVWITGASSGIGEGVAKQLATKGAKLVLSARNEQELQRVADICIASGCEESSVLVLPLDVGQFDTMTAAKDRVLEYFGRIDLLINNAGVSQRSLCLETDMSVYETMMHVNVLGQIALTKIVLPVMVEQGEGHVAVTASVAGKVGVPIRTGYCAAKHAVMGFFDALRTEVAHLGINVTTITPGFIHTNVSINALTGDGSPTGTTDENIANGMDVTECCQIIVEGFENGVEEIAMGGEQEMGLLQLKREDPSSTFRLLETMAEEALKTQ
ncbi:MAG: short chain dehydrogenase [Cellvibrionaceae bacterium]|nr:short chain dehydrogenase [Cellvibrionaceae bacterium]